MLPQAQGRRRLSLEISIAALGVLGTALLGISLAWNIVQIRGRTLDGALIQARVAYEKDIVFRRWNNQYGGVYVDAAVTPPNPYLADIPERDIRTPSGKTLTLVNPAYMTRQVFEMSQAQYGFLAHLTSLNPIRPQNAADPWETEALKALGQGESEFSSLQTIDNQEYMRMMK